MARRKRRNFTAEFKAEVVIEALSGKSSQEELCCRHNLSTEQLSKWKHPLLENAATLFESTGPQSDASIEQIAELEQRVGNRLTLALEIHKQVLEEIPRQKYFAEREITKQMCLDYIFAIESVMREDLESFRVR